MRPIDADAFRFALMLETVPESEYMKGYTDAVSDMKVTIENLPTVTDTNGRGYWITGKHRLLPGSAWRWFKCSACGRTTAPAGIMPTCRYAYCPHCGASMKNEE